MFRGFLVGSLTLIVLYVVIQPGASERTVQGSNAIMEGVRRLFSSQVAGIGDHSKTTAVGKAPQDDNKSNPSYEPPLETWQGTLFT